MKPTYQITAPVFDRVTIHLNPDYFARGDFTIVTRNNSPQNIYIQRAWLNGQPLKRCWFDHADLVRGGKLEIELGPEPNRAWDSANKSISILHQPCQLPAGAAQRKMLQFGGPDPFLHQVLRAAAVVRHILSVVAIQRDAKARDAVPQRLAMLAGRDGHAGQSPHILDQLAMDVGLLLLPGWQSGGNPRAPPSGGLRAIGSAARGRGGGRARPPRHRLELRPRLGTGDFVLQPALLGKAEPHGRAGIAGRRRACGRLRCPTP